MLEIRLENSEILIVEDGCTDKTPELSEKYAANYQNVKHLHFDQRLGKGRAIKEGINKSSKPISLYVDADYSCSIEDIINVRNQLEEGFDVATGSKYRHKESEISKGRRLKGKLYNMLARTAIGTELTDHQCGLKAFKTDDILELFDSVREEKWFFDTEIINEAKKRNLSIKEVPVRWRQRPSKVPKYAPLLGIETLYKIKLEQIFNKGTSDLIGQFNRFASVGALGAVVNTLILHILTEYGGIWYMASAVIATEAAIIFMFLLNNRITFKPMKKGFKELFEGIINSNVVRSAGIVVQLLLLYLFTESLNIHYILSNILSIFIASALTFYGEKFYNWNNEG